MRTKHATLTWAKELANRYGISFSEIAMRYVFSNETNIFAVVSTTSTDQLQMNLYAQIIR